MKSAKIKKKVFLDGHKRVGKRFIPPMKQLKGYQSVGYVDNMLPELIWIGLLNQKIGYVLSSRIMESMFIIIDRIIENTEVQGNFALMSNFAKLSSKQKIKILIDLKRQGILSVLVDAISPLNILYPETPLGFIGVPETPQTQSELIDQMKECIKKNIDKYSVPGVILNGAILLSRLVTRKIFFSKDIKLPDFNTVLTDPESDEGKHAASFMRANALSEFGLAEVDPSWARYFWNRGFDLSPCEFGAEEGDSEN